MSAASAPNPAPLTVTVSPTATIVGAIELIEGTREAGSKSVSEFAEPRDEDTATLPADAPAGTSATIRFALSVVTAAVVPPNVTVLEPASVPNPVP
ncbi:MAG TPA: hypothetical protein VIF63_07190 [Candidatus Limnocylindrales bacterium]